MKTNSYTKVKKENLFIYIGPDQVQKFVPIVIKNRDQLVGFLEGIEVLKTFSGMTIQEKRCAMDSLSSNRFNDLTKYGLKTNDLDIDKFIDLILDKITEQIDYENTVPELESKGILDEMAKELKSFLHIDCPGCGMSRTFNDAKEIPKHNLKCDICDSTLIDYTGKEDSEFCFDGNIENNILCKDMEIEIWEDQYYAQEIEEEEDDEE